jgi:hypothetical protein
LDPRKPEEIEQNPEVRIQKPKSLVYLGKLPVSAKRPSPQKKTFRFLKL